MTDFDLDKICKFEDLQKASCILRKALKEIRTITNAHNSNFNSLNLSSSSSSNNSSIYIKPDVDIEVEDHELDLENFSNTPKCLAFDNLTYFSSVEDLGQIRQTTSNQEVLKKTLKSIKRKDKLKKSPNIEDTEDDVLVNLETQGPVLSHAKSMPDLSNWQDEANNGKKNEVTISKKDENPNDLISNGEYEKQLRKIFRNKSLSRSLRRAKSVYYRNQRSKSLEDLTVEEKINFLLNTNSSYLKLDLQKKSSRRGSRHNSTLSVNSCSSGTSNGLASDISSSYFHELSDWSPEFSSSESESSEDEIFQNTDWDFSNLALSGYNTSVETDETDESDTEEDKKPKRQFLSNSQKSVKAVKMSQNQSLNEILLAQKLDHDAETVEKMLNEVMNRILNMHPSGLNADLNKSNNFIDYSKILKTFQITSNYLNDPSSQLKCFVCMSMFDQEDDATNLNCDHTFHSNCIQVWLSKSSSCPICRHSHSKRPNPILSENNRMLQKRETLL